MQTKEIISNIDEKDYWKKANLHTHSCYSDGTCEFDVLIEQAKSLGLHHFSICDHNTIEGYKKTKFKNDPLIIPAIEIDCIIGCFPLHILGYGIDVENPVLNKFCEEMKGYNKKDLLRLIHSKNPKEAIDIIHLAGGIAVLAHPCCCFTFNLDRFIKRLADIGLDGVEVYYPYGRFRGILKFHSRKTAKKIAKKYNLILTGGTDEHKNLI